MIHENLKETQSQVLNNRKNGMLKKIDVRAKVALKQLQDISLQ